MKVLGIDPGLALTGWGIISKEGIKIELLDCGCIRTSKTEEITRRLKIIYDELAKIVERTKPEEAALESLFFNTNAKTAFLVGQARGVVALACAQKGLPVFEYTPLQVKIAVTGYGRAEKGQVQRMVKNILKLERIPKPDDTADAVAIALTHCFSKGKNL